MDKPLSESTQAKARELAARITVTHNFDPEIQEELYGHIEDKLLAYKSGEEEISEEDALILAREHFGNIETVHGLLKEVHMGTTEVGLARKIFTLVIAGAAIGIVGKVALCALGAGIVLAGVSKPLAGDGFLVLSLAIQWGVLFAVYRTLSRWKDGVDCGASIWYVRWSLSRMVVWTVSLYVVGWAIPAVSISRESGGAWGIHFTSVFYLVSVLGLSVASCSLWLWWSGAFASGRRNTLKLGAWWIVYMIVFQFQPAAVSVNVGSGKPVAFGVVPMASGNWGETSVAAYLTYLGPWRTFGELSMVVGIFGVFAVASCLMAVACRSIWLRRSVGGDHPGMPV